MARVVGGNDPNDLAFFERHALIAEGNIMKRIALVVGVLSVLLGGLWLLQGLGVVHVRPILCFANCAPVQGPSSTWATTGAFALAAGVLAILYSRKRGARR